MLKTSDSFSLAHLVSPAASPNMSFSQIYLPTRHYLFLLGITAGYANTSFSCFSVSLNLRYAQPSPTDPKVEAASSPPINESTNPKSGPATPVDSPGSRRSLLSPPIAFLTEIPTSARTPTNASIGMSWDPIPEPEAQDDDDLEEEVLLAGAAEPFEFPAPVLSRL